MNGSAGDSGFAYGLALLELSRRGHGDHQQTALQGMPRPQQWVPACWLAGPCVIGHFTSPTPSLLDDVQFSPAAPSVHSIHSYPAAPRGGIVVAANDHRLTVVPVERAVPMRYEVRARFAIGSTDRHCKYLCLVWHGL